MKAAVVRSFSEPLVIEDRPDPEPGPGQVRIRLEASGLCHTDIHAAHGDWPVKPTPPFVPGHEGVGIVEALGDGVTHLAVGQRVAVPWLGWACGRCEHCLSGWETLCEQQQNTGYSVDGGYAEKMLAPADFAAVVPDGIDPRDAAPLTCAGVTTYKALKVADVRPTQLVAISGVGGLGHLAVQYAKIAGATVAAIDVTDEKLELARELGADILIDARKEDPAEVLKQHGGAHAAIALAVNEQAFASVYGGLRRGGKLVMVALPAGGTISVPIFDTVLNGTSVIGSIVGTRQDLDEVFQLHAAGRTKVIYETRPLDTVNDSITEVLNGQIKARIVFEM
ncbi:alcohol dehydrogenase AdhP [Streptomyces aurantiogriseus]|uniref:Alcohol dehydrogenase n=1 Tax=Streptomyces aurantiogriseus TaxID=66870 RepID=A0A918FLH7_9ACTN|nr:alcohol dehydrogenase AdhP [Streptomyces aurantiogriseus]GGR51784.1 zinc-dependent alcohol dehydrogenase [Streptomyces aurantiogriseus]